MLMKKYLLFLLAFLPMVLCTSCSSDDDDETNQPQKLSSIEINFDFTPYDMSAFSTSKQLYTREIYLFNMEGKHIKEPITPFSMETKDYGWACAIDDVNGENIYCDYSGEFSQKKDNDGYYTFNCVDAIYNYNFLSKKELSRGLHLLVIKINGSYFCKKIDINPKNFFAEYDFHLVQTATNGKVDRFIWF